MPKVTQVEPQKNNSRRFNIFLDGAFAFGADEDLVVEHRLTIGKIIESSMVEKLLFEAEVGKLMERMYGLFNIRKRSEREVRDYVKSLSFKRKVKGNEEISIAAIELLIEKLKHKKLLSDIDFARSWVEARRRSKKLGKIAIKQELFQKGIDRDIIEEILGQTKTGDEEDLARQALEKRHIKKEKIYGFLARKGFDANVIKSVVEKMSELK